MKIIFATHNRHKVEEIRAVLGKELEIISLTEASIHEEIPEPYPTLRENAQTKAQTIHLLTGENCFSEDSGLEVDALGGEPGVHSARYAGEPVSYEKNTLKLLDALGNNPDRRARFITVICLIWDKKEYFFEGRCEGQIREKKSGNGGFGYDPVFVPEGARKTFAEMNTAEKNLFSHRRKAVDLLIAFLRTRSAQ